MSRVCVDSQRASRGSGGSSWVWFPRWRSSTWPTAPATRLLSMCSHNTGTVREWVRTVCAQFRNHETKTGNINVSVICDSEALGEYMESKGASTPGILTLTTSLSKPFTRLQRYPTLLKELDRHMEVSLSVFIQINQQAKLARFRWY